MRDALGSIRRILLLGGTSEIGLAIVRALIRERGASEVVLAGRDPQAMAGAASELETFGAKQVETVAFDADDVDSHEAFVADVRTRGDIDVVVLAFGVLGDQYEMERDPQAAIRVMRTNGVGTVSIGMHIGELLHSQGHGDLVVLSSVAGLRGRRSNYVYGATKSATDTFAQGLGDRLHAAGAHVLIVRPGFVHSRMTAGMDPAPFSTTPEAVADVTVAALQKRATVAYAPGVLRWLMLVLRALPRVVFRQLPS